MTIKIGGKNIQAKTLDRKKQSSRNKKPANNGKLGKSVPSSQQKKQKKKQKPQKTLAPHSLDESSFQKIKDAGRAFEEELKQKRENGNQDRNIADKYPNRKRKVDKNLTDAYKYEKRLSSKKEEYEGIRDIAGVPPFSNFDPIDFSKINWERRLACKNDPLLDLQTYFPRVFYLQWAEFHKGLIHNLEEKMDEGGKKAFGMPRASGKTAITRAMIIRATKFGMRKFAFFVGSKEDKAIQTLDFIRGNWHRNLLLRQDFPEIGYPVYRLEGRAGIGALGQTFHGERTHINWSTKDVQYPTLLLTEEEAAGYLKHVPDSVIYLPDVGIEIPRFVINSSGTVIRVAGIDGSIRGEADIHPILLTQPRPDMVLLDDVQKEQKADSPKSCQDLEKLIESAVDYLSAPDIAQAMLMPCTVIREGDVSDTYLDPLQKPEWNGERHGVICKYPKGIDDNVIMEEIDGKPYEQGQLWNRYREVREESFRKYGNLKLANDFYKEHKDVMSKGFEITWEDRFKSDSKNKAVNEIDALQSAMNARFKDHGSFMSELQNRPKPKEGILTSMPTPAEIMEKMANIPRNELSIDWTNLVCFLDVQDELLFYMIFAHNHEFTGQIIDYGTIPQITTPYFRKSQTAGWSQLTRMYYRDYPENRPSNLYKNNSTKERAPFEAKIYHACKTACNYLLSREFMQDGNPKRIRAIAIDTQWGKASETIKRFVREYRNPKVICYHGNAFPPSHKQLEEYQPTPGWLFEHQQFPHVKESKWVVKPSIGGGQYIVADVNRLKSFLMARLTTPLGAKGSISIFAAQPDIHRMLADHIARSEYPEPITARGMSKECWQPRVELKNDNDYLDCAAGCMCLASICGASIKTSEMKPIKKRSIRNAYEKKRREK